MTRGFSISAAMHAVICLLLIFGLPHLFEPEIIPEPMVIAVDVMNIRDVTNLPPMPTPKKKKPEKIEPPKPPKAEPPKKPVEKELVKNEPPKVAPPEPPKEKPKPPEPVVKKEEPKKEKPKPEEKKKEEKKEEPTLEDILKNISDQPKKTETKPAESQPSELESKSMTDKPFDPAMQVSATVQDAIRGQISRCWNFMGGMKDQDKMRATLRVQFSEDGGVVDVRLHGSQAGEYNSNTSFRALVDSAMRAVRNPSCTPLKGLPKEQFRGWEYVDLSFDPSGLL